MFYTVDKTVATIPTPQPFNEKSTFPQFKDQLIKYLEILYEAIRPKTTKEKIAIVFSRKRIADHPQYNQAVLDVIKKLINTLKTMQDIQTLYNVFTEELDILLIWFMTKKNDPIYKVLIELYNQIKSFCINNIGMTTSDSMSEIYERQLSEKKEQTEKRGDSFSKILGTSLTKSDTYYCLNTFYNHAIPEKRAAQLARYAEITLQQFEFWSPDHDQTVLTFKRNSDGRGFKVNMEAFDPPPNTIDDIKNFFKRFGVDKLFINFICDHFHANGCLYLAENVKIQLFEMGILFATAGSTTTYYFTWDPPAKQMKIQYIFTCEGDVDCDGRILHLNLPIILNSSFILYQDRSAIKIKNLEYSITGAENITDVVLGEKMQTFFQKQLQSFNDTRLDTEEKLKKKLLFQI